MLVIDDGLFELKCDGFRALAHVRRDGADLVLRDHNRFGQSTALTGSCALI